MYAGIYCGVSGVAVAVAPARGKPPVAYYAFGMWSRDPRVRLARSAQAAAWAVERLAACEHLQAVAVADYPRTLHNRKRLVYLFEMGLMLRIELLRRRWKVIEVPLECVGWQGGEAGGQDMVERRALVLAQSAMQGAQRRRPAYAAD